MKTKSRLKYQPDSDFTIIAISCSESISRMSWILNKNLKLNLIYSGKLKLFHEKFENTQKFSVYAHTNADGTLVYRLIENKSDDGFMSQEYRNFDFFLQCISPQQEKLNQILSAIKLSEDVLFADFLKIPDKNFIQKLML